MCTREYVCVCVCAGEQGKDLRCCHTTSVEKPFQASFTYQIEGHPQISRNTSWLSTLKFFTRKSLFLVLWENKMFYTRKKQWISVFPMAPTDSCTQECSPVPSAKIPHRSATLMIPVCWWSSWQDRWLPNLSCSLLLYGAVTLGVPCLLNAIIKPACL